MRSRARMTVQFLYEPLHLKQGGTRPFRFFSRVLEEQHEREFVLQKNGEWKPTELLELARFGHNDVITVEVSADQARGLIEQYWGAEAADKALS